MSKPVDVNSVGEQNNETKSKRIDQTPDSDFDKSCLDLQDQQLEARLEQEDPNGRSEFSNRNESHSLFAAHYQTPLDLFPASGKQGDEFWPQFISESSQIPEELFLDDDSADYLQNYGNINYDTTNTHFALLPFSDHVYEELDSQTESDLTVSTVPDLPSEVYEEYEKDFEKANEDRS